MNSFLAPRIIGLGLLQVEHFSEKCGGFLRAGFKSSYSTPWVRSGNTRKSFSRAEMHPSTGERWGISTQTSGHKKTRGKKKKPVFVLLYFSSWRISIYCELPEAQSAPKCSSIWWYGVGSGLSPDSSYKLLLQTCSMLKRDPFPVATPFVFTFSRTLLPAILSLTIIGIRQYFFSFNDAWQFFFTTFALCINSWNNLPEQIVTNHNAI